MPRFYVCVLFWLSICVPALGQPTSDDDAGTTPRPAIQPLAEIPYHIGYDGLVIVNVMIDGEGPYEFVVDTGATITIFFENLTRLHPASPPIGDTRRIIGITGAAWLPVHSINRLNLGPLRFDDHKLVVMKDWGADRATPQGIIGLDILARYLVVFDMDHHIMRLYPPDAANDVLYGWRAAPLQPVSTSDLSRPLYAVTTTMKGTQVPMVVDLGAEETVINYAALGKVMRGDYNTGYHMSGSGLAFGAKFHDLFDNREEAKVVNINRLLIGGAPWLHQTLVVFDANFFTELNVADRPYGLLGAKVLLARNFAIDIYNSRLLIGPATRPVARNHD